MQAKKNKPNHQVSILTQVARMKYIPSNFVKPTPICKPIQQVGKDKTQTKSKFSFSSIFSGRNKSKIQPQIISQSEILMPKQESVIVTEPESISEPIPNYKLKFTCRIASEHYVIGNQFQLDLITILGINHNRFVQTQYLWSFKFKQPISHVSADQKKFNLLAIVTGKKLYIYKYDPKKITDEKFVPFRQVILTEQPHSMQVAKDGNICILYKQRAQIRLVGQQIRIRYDKKYPKPQTFDPQKSDYALFMVPQPYQNIVNVFFEQRKKEKSKVFTLWCVQFEFLASQIRTSLPHKIYDIKIGYRNSLNIKNYSKQLFLINFGSQILALKKGYILDSANVNLKHQESCLQYIGNNTLLHISQKKIQVYYFEININIKPYRINIKPKDSIKILSNQKQDQYFKVLNVYAKDLIIIYQKGSLNSRSKTGQIQYSFYITRSISRDQKMNQLFPRGFGQDFKIDDPVLMDKCDMAQKMGFTKRQIYLLLWNRSLQLRQQEYNILIATGDYSTIKEQIIKKLKKSSLTLTQIQKNEKNSFLMLQQRVFTSQCTEQTAMDYMSSHFFRRKLQMFTELLTMQKLQKQYKKQPIEDPSKYNKITIRDYQQIKSMQIKSELISLVNQLCHEGKKNLSKNIRFLLRNFKFVFRTIYYQLLDQIIKNAKSSLLQLLVEIPQLLPYTPPEQQRSYILAGFFQGVWPEITRQQWSDSLYLDAITTIDNKQVILEQVVKNLNFKRNWLSQHDVILWSVDKIKQNYTKIKSCQTFYYFIAKMFENIKDVSVLQKIVQFLQNTYQLPENIRGNVFLMQKMYRFFVRKNIVPEIQGRPITLSQFLSFEDKQFIRHCFQKQRSNKGLLLKDLKDIFKQVLKQQANQRYNKALLNYFISDLSEVSDLKYILNRINNQKLEFHQENQQMYEVLVQALERKMKIGTDNDIPIEEVLIYIQNIPLKFNTQSSVSLDELKAVQKIDKDSQFLRQAKVNMSIYDILHDYEQVLTKLIKHAIDSSNDQVWANFQNFYNFSIQKIALLQNFCQQIYDNSYEKAIFFLYITKICEDKQRIKFADFLIKNQHFNQKLDECTIQGLVLFMKKWKLSLQKQYIKCQDYIQQLLVLLPEGSDFVQFIQSQLKFARMLSSTHFPVTYPISLGYIAASDVRDIIFDLPVDFIMTVNIQQLYQNIDKMQQILLAYIDEDQQQQMSPANCMTRHQIYEFFILKLIQSNKLKQVLPLIKNLLLLPIKQPNYNIVYMLMFIIQISGQFNQYNRKSLLECIWFYFNQPIELHNIFQYILNVPLSNRQVKQYIQQCLVNGKAKSKGYNAMNLLLNDEYLSAIQTAQHQHTFLAALQNAMNHIQQSKQQFKHIKYAVIVIMLCHHPYTLAKYISCVKYHDLQIKNVQSFFSYFIQEKIFKPLLALQLGRRIFLVLLQVQRNKYPLEIILQKYGQDNFENQINIDNFTPISDHKSYQYLLWKTAQAFKKKKNILQQQIINKPQSIDSNEEQDSQRIRSLLGKIANLKQRQPIQHQFNQIDSDQQIGNIQEIEENKKKKKIKQTPKFDPSQQLKNALKSQNRSKLFMSTRGQMVKNSGSLSISIHQKFKPTHQKYKSSHQRSYNQIQQVPNQYKLSDNKFMDGFQQNSSQDFNQFQKKAKYHTVKQIYQRPSHSGIESEPINLADSQPEILNQYKKNNKIIEGQQLMNSQQVIQLSQEKSCSFNNDKQVENQYAIQVKQVYDEDQLEQMMQQNQNSDKVMQQSPLCQSAQSKNPVTGIIQQLILDNKQALQNPLVDFNLTVLAPHQTNTQIIINVIQQLYLSHCNMPNLNRVLKLMGQIVFTFPACNLNPQIFSTIIKAQQAQAKTIPQIKFTQLIPLDTLCIQYKSKRDLFQKMYYQNLSKYVDSENIYKITQFIRRVFDNAVDFEQEVTWDFILQLSDKLQYCEEQDRSWNIEKIIANLPKIQLKVWNRKITNFQTKVLGSPFKQELLKVFCGYLEDKNGDSDAIQFLETVGKLDKSIKIKQTLQIIKR